MKDGIKTDERGSFVWRNENGNVHRLNNLPAFIGQSGYKGYCICGVKHRTNGPARMFNSGCKQYWVDGIEHEKPKQYTLWICNKVELT